MRKLDRAAVNGGLATFVTVAYIAAVNAAILGSAGMNPAQVATATIVTIVASTLASARMGLPLAIGPGMGLNTLFLAAVLTGTPAREALAVCFWSGAILVAINATRLRQQIVEAFPLELKLATVIGLGLFVAAIGFSSAGVTEVGKHGVQLAPISLQVGLALVGLLTIVILHIRGISWAVLGGIGVAMAAGLATGVIPLPDTWLSSPDFGSFLEADLLGALKLRNIPLAFGIVLITLLDTVAVVEGMGAQAGVTSEEKERWVRQGLILSSLSTMFGGLVGTSPSVVFIESSAGIASGARDGRAAAVTALCFVPALFLTPLLGAIPAWVTGPALIFVGSLMFGAILEKVLGGSYDKLFPAFIIVAGMVLTGSISRGLMAGTVCYVILAIASGRRKELTPVFYVLASLGAFFIYRL